MPLRHSDLIEVRPSRNKGRGVFALKKIRKGAIIERTPMIPLPVREIFTSGALRTTLADYVFKWGKNKVALALGYGSLYNHSYQPNALFYIAGPRTLVFRAVRNIEAGEEIKVNYHAVSRRPVSFQVEE